MNVVKQLESNPKQHGGQRSEHCESNQRNLELTKQLTTQLPSSGAGLSKPAPLDFLDVPPEKCEPIINHLLATMCVLAGHRFGGIWEAVWLKGSCILPKSVVVISSVTHSTYTIPVKDVSAGGAQLIRNVVRQKDQAFLRESIP